MTLIISYLALVISQISIFFYLKNDLNSIVFINKVNKFVGFDSSIEQKAIDASNPTEKEVPVITIPKAQACADLLLLDKSLKHLEFIAQFECYLEKKNSEKFSAEFLQEFENIKREAQIDTIKTTQQLSSALALAA